MEPLTPSLDSDSSTWHETKRKKRRRKLEEGDEVEEVNETVMRFDDGNDADDNGNRNVAKKRRWRTERELLIYSSKLVDALRRVRSGSSPSTSAGKGGGEIRKTADRVLAVSARGTTRWSRAILASRLKAARRSIANKHKKAKKRVTGDSRLSKKKKVEQEIVENRRRRRLPAVEKKVKTLSRLVPGCRKVSFTNLLEEASDYIAALEMQVKAMTALSEVLAGASSPVDRLSWSGVN